MTLQWSASTAEHWTLNPESLLNNGPFFQNCLTYPSPSFTTPRPQLRRRTGDEHSKNKRAKYMTTVRLELTRIAPLVDTECCSSELSFYFSIPETSAITTRPSCLCQNKCHHVWYNFEVVDTTADYFGQTTNSIFNVEQAARSLN